VFHGGGTYTNEEPVPCQKEQAGLEQDPVRYSGTASRSRKA